VKRSSVRTLIAVILALAATALAAAAVYAIVKVGWEAAIGEVCGVIAAYFLWQLLRRLLYDPAVTTDPTPPHAAPDADKPAPDGTGKIEQLKIIGGLVALGSGLVALVAVVIAAFIAKPDTTAGSIATSAIGVIGSIVGAYFGVKIGSDGTAKAVEGQKEEATKAQVFALHTPPEQAEAAMRDIHGLIGDQPAPRRRT